MLMVTPAPAGSIRESRDRLSQYALPGRLRKTDGGGGQCGPEDDRKFGRLPPDPVRRQAGPTLIAEGTVGSSVEAPASRT